MERYGDLLSVKSLVALNILDEVKNAYDIFHDRYETALKTILSDTTIINQYCDDISKYHNEIQKSFYGTYSNLTIGSSYVNGLINGLMMKQWAERNNIRENVMAHFYSDLLFKTFQNLDFQYGEIPVFKDNKFWKAFCCNWGQYELKCSNNGSWNLDILTQYGFEYFLKMISLYVCNSIFIYYTKYVQIEENCQDEIYQSLKDYIREAEKIYEANISEQWGDTDPVTLMVYQDIENIPCQKRGHNIITLHKSVPLLNKSTSIRIPVHFCKNCGKSFIGEKTLEYCIQNYGKLNIRIKQAEPQDAVYSKGFSDESQLHSYGYNVVAGGLTTKDRRDILVRLLNQNLMTYEEIRRDLETSIYIFENRESYQAAIDKWRGDLKFITDYYNQL